MLAHVVSHGCRCRDYKRHMKVQENALQQRRASSHTPSATIIATARHCGKRACMFVRSVYIWASEGAAVSLCGMQACCV